MTAAGGLYRERLDIELPMTLLTSLHVGAATTRLFDPPSVEGNEPSFQVSTFLTTTSEHGDIPYLPGTSIKGVLRQRFDETEPADEIAARRLFGWASPDDQQTSEMGLLQVYAALPENREAAARAIVRGRERPARRTALDPDTGAAAAARLFAYDTVPPGIRFVLRMRLLLPGSAKSEAEDALSSLLERLRERPLELGRGTKTAQGQAQAELNALRVTRREWRAGQFVPTDETDWPRSPSGGGALPSQTAARWTFLLKCSGPYLSKDPFAVPPPNAPGNVIEARCGADGRAELLPTSLLGALRQRAAWEERLSTGRADQPDLPLRRRFLDERRNGQTLDAFVRTELTPVERLFGVNGFRGLLRIESLACEADEGTISSTSVALDRFSMAPKHGALYTVRARLRPRFRVVVSIERRAADLPSASDVAFLRALLSSFATDDLLLGYGTTKGFGWFRIEEFDDG